MFLFAFDPFLDKMYKTYIKIATMISEIKNDIRNILNQNYLKFTKIIKKN